MAHRVDSVADVLVDLLDDNRRRIGRLFDQMSDDCLYWAPDAGTNSIAITVWHIARLFDLFLTCMAQGRPIEEQRWFAGGWAERTSYDPRGLGQQGWGTLNGYSPAEVAAIPRLAREQLLGYLDEVYAAVRADLRETDSEGLQRAAPGFDGHYSRYQVVQMALMDNVRHLGECYALQARWKREGGR